MRRRGAGRHRSAGQSLVEFALILPIIVFVASAFVEIGRAVFAWNTIGNAARQGARVAIVNQIDLPTECDQSRPVEDPSYSYWSIKGCTIAAAKTLGVDIDSVMVSYSAPPGTTLSCSPQLHVGCIASVTVTYEYAVSTPFLNFVIHSFPMSQTSQMPIERVFP